MTSAWTDAQVADFFATLPASPYLSCHVTNPSLGGLGAGEVTGGGYVRQALTLSSVASRSVHNANAIEFISMPAVTVTYLGIYDAPTAGVLRAYIQVPGTGITLTAGGQLPINVGDLALTF